MTTEEMTAPSDAGREPRGFDRGPREDRSSRDDRGGDRDDRGGGRRFGARRRGCAFCIDKIETPDYKDVSMLRRYVTERGKLESRRKVGTCAKHQRFVALAVKRARQVALLPYTAEQDRTSGVLGGGRSSSSGRR